MLKNSIEPSKYFKFFKNERIQTGGIQFVLVQLQGLHFGLQKTKIHIDLIFFPSKTKLIVIGLQMNDEARYHFFIQNQTEPSENINLDEIRVVTLDLPEWRIIFLFFQDY